MWCNSPNKWDTPNTSYSCTSSKWWMRAWFCCWVSLHHGQKTSSVSHFELLGTSSEIFLHWRASSVWTPVSTACKPNCWLKATSWKQVYPFCWMVAQILFNSEGPSHGPVGMQKRLLQLDFYFSYITWSSTLNIGELVATVDKLIEPSLSLLSQIWLINLWSAS